MHDTTTLIGGWVEMEQTRKGLWKIPMKLSDGDRVDIYASDGGGPVQRH